MIKSYASKMLKLETEYLKIESKYLHKKIDHERGELSDSDLIEAHKIYKAELEVFSNLRDILLLNDEEETK